METHRRSILKALSWRLWALMITTTVAWILTSSVEFAAAIGVLDTLIKVFVYYLHERFWVKVNYGRQQPKYPDYQI